MKAIAGLSARVLKELREAFFDISPDGVLVYLDPMIGTMRHARHHLSVRINGEKNQVELHHRGAPAREFSFADGVRRACENAFGAYFTMLQELSQSRVESKAA